MKAYNLLEQAVLLAGGTTPDELIKKTGVSIINTLLTDLGRESISSLSDEISSPHIGFFTTLTSGIAMMLAILWGDDEGASTLSEVYNSSRRRLLGKISRVKPTLFGGGDNEI